VAVEDAAHGVGNGLVVVVALDEDGEQVGDAALALVPPGPALSRRRGNSAKTDGV
jgi:hypothetical protein